MRRLSLVCAVLIGITPASFSLEARADLLEAVLSGHYDDTGSFIGETPSTENYSVGFVIDPIKPFGDPDKLFVRRNYFVFDLSTVTSPVSEASLVLPIGGYVGEVPMFDFVVTSSVFSGAEVADPTLLASMSPLEIFATLGVASTPGQELVGEAMIVKADIPGLGPSPELVIPLDVTFFNDSIGSEIVLGGRIASDEGPEDIFAPGFVVPPDGAVGVEDERILFAFTNPNGDTIDSILGETVRPRIEFVTIPEPRGILIGLLAAILMAAVAGSGSASNSQDAAAEQR